MKPRKILVVHRGAIGDFLLVLPAIAVLRERFPHARFEFLGHGAILCLVENRHYADSISSIERAELTPFFTRREALPRQAVEYFSRFDLVVAWISDPEGVFRSNLQAVGVAHALVCDPFPPMGTPIHLSEYFVQCLRPLGFNRVADPARIHLSQEDHDLADDLLLRLFPDATGYAGLFAVHPGSGSKKKRWPIERFAAVTQMLARSSPANILVICGPAEEDMEEKVQQCFSPVAHRILKNVPLDRLAAVLARCRCYLGNDSGITHLAAAVGTPTVAIFGPTDPKQWAPTGPRVTVVRRQVACSPCTREARSACRTVHCLESVTVEETLRAIEDTMALHQPRQRAGKSDLPH